MGADVLGQRIDALVALFTHVAQTRMEGIPILNPALRVEAVGFEVLTEPVKVNPSDDVQSAPRAPLDPMAVSGGVGILITPWFMNLVWIPAVRVNFERCTGISRVRNVGTDNFNFIGAFEPSIGSYEACSLFSPMFEFPDHDAARDTAQAVLAALRRAVPVPPMPAVPLVRHVAPLVDIPARRAFLFGRRPANGGAL